MRLALSFVLLGLVFAGCDGSDPDPDPGPGLTCASGLSTQGSFSATVGSDAFSADCFEVQVRTIPVPGGTAEVLTVTGSVLGTQAESITIVTGAVGTGVFSIQDRADIATAAETAYTLGSDTRIAESGSVTISQYSDSRVQGALDVVLDDATTVDGAFDISY